MSGLPRSAKGRGQPIAPSRLLILTRRRATRLFAFRQPDINQFSRVSIPRRNAIDYEARIDRVADQRSNNAGVPTIAAINGVLRRRRRLGSPHAATFASATQDREIRISDRGATLGNWPVGVQYRPALGLGRGQTRLKEIIFYRAA